MRSPSCYNQLIREDRRGTSASPYDCFTRTTTRNHARVTTDMFRTLYEHGWLHRADHARRVLRRRRAARCPDRYIEGTCPICGYPGGARRPVRQLRQPARPDRPDQPARRSSTGRRRSSARRSTSSSTCLAFAGSRCVRGSRRRTELAAERLELLARPRSTTSSRGAMTRDIDWGHAGARWRATPTGPTSGIYVWFDAVIGYLSAARRVGRRTGGRRTHGATWWQNPTRRTAYFMGKDNIVFHTVIWPAHAARATAAGGRARRRRGRRSTCPTRSSRASS